MEVDPSHKNILIIGSANSGKSSFLLRLEDKIPPIQYFPSQNIEEKFYYEYTSSKRKKEKYYLDFSVIPGNFNKIDEYREFFYDTNSVFIFINLEDYSSLEEAGGWLDEIILIYSTSIPIIIVGCKCDSLSRKINKDEAKNFFQEKIKYIEISNRDESYLNVFSKLF